MDRGAPVPVMEAPARAKGRFGYRADMREFSFTKRHAPLRETLARIEGLIGRDNVPTAAIQMLPLADALPDFRSEEHTSELQSLMRISYAVFCLKKKKSTHERTTPSNQHYK